MRSGIAAPVAVVFIALVLVVVGLVVKGRNPVQEATQKVADIAGGGSFNFDPETPGYENFKKLKSGGVPRDGIPSIDKPKFESVGAADAWLASDDIVFVLEYKGEVRAYPQKILNWHEIVNDTVAGDPLAITFCPLCGSALTFDRRVNGQTLEFGVSGLLHNNDLVMYDRETETLWQQITGEALVGELFGKRLRQVPTSGMRWSDFKSQFLNGQVLSRDTGFSRDYERDPYSGYEADPNPLFPVEGGVDQTIHPKTVVYGVEAGGSFKAYPLEKIEEDGTIKDRVGGISVEVSYNNGNVEVKNTDTGEELSATRLFWFAWKAFRPETQLY